MNRTATTTTKKKNTNNDVRFFLTGATDADPRIRPSLHIPPRSPAVRIQQPVAHEHRHDLDHRSHTSHELLASRPPHRPVEPGALGSLHTQPGILGGTHLKLLPGQ